jgi:SpoVK/Ycf46/Vps4 family AAA+-type ATPase
MRSRKEETKVERKRSNTSSKLSELLKKIPRSAFEPEDLQSIDYLLNYFHQTQDPLLSSRSFMFFGHPGIGKTYLARQLLSLIDKDVIYLGCETIQDEKIVSCKSLKDVVTKIKNQTEQVIYLDDLSYLFDDSTPGFIRSDQKRAFLQLLDIIKQNPKKLLLITTNTFYPLDEQMMDRIEVKIYIDFPDAKQKRSFLKKQYQTTISPALQRYIADKSVGYNFRDLTEIIKAAYRQGSGKITKNSLSKVFPEYEPSGLFGFNVVSNPGKTLNDVIGKKQILESVHRTTYFYKNRSLRDALGVRRENLLMFYGPQGTGKTFMASAIAGELGLPLITVGGDMIHERNAFQAVRRIMYIARRYQRCVIFIDEAEKLLGNGRFEEDNPVLGELHRCIDGDDDGDIKAIVVFAVNELCRFGPTLLDRFTLVEFDFPSVSERREYFQKKYNALPTQNDMGVTVEGLAHRTEHMSYRQLDRYWNNLISTQVCGGRKGSVVMYGGRAYRHTDIMFG